MSIILTKNRISRYHIVLIEFCNNMIMIKRQFPFMKRAAAFNKCLIKSIQARCYLPSSKKSTSPRQVRLSGSLPADINITRLIRPLTWPPLQQLPFPERRKAPAHSVRIHIHIHPVRLSWNEDLYNIL